LTQHIHPFMQSHLHSPSFFIHDTATTEIYTLSLHDALPISLEHYETNKRRSDLESVNKRLVARMREIQELTELEDAWLPIGATRSEEHTSELQSLRHLVCRLLLEKKKTKIYNHKYQSHPYSM